MVTLDTHSHQDLCFVIWFIDHKSQNTVNCCLISFIIIIINFLLIVYQIVSASQAWIWDWVSTVSCEFRSCSTISFSLQRLCCMIKKKMTCGSLLLFFRWHCNFVPTFFADGERERERKVGILVFTWSSVEQIWMNGVCLLEWWSMATAL